MPSLSLSFIFSRVLSHLQKFWISQKIENEHIVGTHMMAADEARSTMMHIHEIFTIFEWTPIRRCGRWFRCRRCLGRRLAACICCWRPARRCRFGGLRRCILLNALLRLCPEIVAVRWFGRRSHSLCMNHFPILLCTFVWIENSVPVIACQCSNENFFFGFFWAENSLADQIATDEAIGFRGRIEFGWELAVRGSCPSCLCAILCVIQDFYSTCNNRSFWSIPFCPRHTQIRHSTHLKVCNTLYLFAPMNNIDTKVGNFDKLGKKWKKICFVVDLFETLLKRQKNNLFFLFCGTVEVLVLM